MYKSDLPKLRIALEALKEDFSNLSPKTEWIALRIVPLLKHLVSLEQLLESEKHSRESSRLTRGVEMFHSDLVYFRTNIKALKKILLSEESSDTKNQEFELARVTSTFLRE